MKPVSHLASCWRAPAVPQPGPASLRPAFLILLLLAATLLGWSQHAWAARATGSVSIGAGHGTIHPGEEVTLAWTALPEGTDEFELLLVCRSPIPVKLRLTECLDPLQGAFRWRVPNLPCDAARILIRAGVGGEEITWAASPPFRIGWDDREPFVQVTSRRGELWLSKPGPRSRETWAWGPDSVSPGGLPGRCEEVGAPSPVLDLIPPEESSVELDPYGRMESGGRVRLPFGRTSPLKLQLRI